MLSVGIDTSIPAGSVGLAGEGIPGGAIEAPCPAPYSETLLPAITSLLAAHGLRLADLDLLAVATGPGSFTGLRIGMATAKGLAIALGIPLAGFSSLETAARAALDLAPGEEGSRAPIAVLQEAGRGEAYRGLYAASGDRIERLLPEGTVPLATALEGIPAQAIVCVDEGSAALAALRAARAGGRWLARPLIGGALARRALAIARREGTAGLPAAVPNYLRPSDAEVHFKG